MKKKLSIAIPTYNRAKELNKTLENLISQINTNNLSDYIEIVVSDNASDDNSGDIVKKFQELNPNITIRYNRNDINIVWENLKKAADLAKGEFVWFCGDDDVYFYNCLKKIIDIIQNNNDIGAIYLNQVNGHGYTTPIEKDSIVSISEFFKITNQDSEFLSTVIIKKDLISPQIKICTWYHMACLLNLPQDTKCYITHSPYVYNKPSKRGWINLENLINYTIDAIETIVYSSAPDEAKKHLMNIYSLFLKRRVVQARIKNFETNYEAKIERLKEISKHSNFDFSKVIKYLKSKLKCKIYFHFKRRMKFKLPYGKDIIFIDSL